jgi:uncharacterized protein YecT (DUF1311 family)
MWHTTYSYPGVKNRLRHAVVTVIALVSFTACRGHSPDSGGDVALARDLAEAQLAGSSASAGGRVASDSDDASNPIAIDPVAASTSADMPVATRNPATRTTPSPAAPSRTSSLRKTSDIAHKPVKQPPADPCSSSDSRDQKTCLSLGTRRSDARLDSVYRLIVKAVRKQQRVPAGAADPPYAATLAQAEKTWTSWRDAECERVTRGKGGDQWAVPRAKCLATLTDERAAELTQILAKVQRR